MEQYDSTRRNAKEEELHSKQCCAALSESEGDLMGAYRFRTSKALVSEATIKPFIAN